MLEVMTPSSSLALYTLWGTHGPIFDVFYPDSIRVCGILKGNGVA